MELLSENQSTYIPIGEKYRLANLGKIPAFLIEVQSGPYLDEGDIVRSKTFMGEPSSPDDLLSSYVTPRGGLTRR